MPKEKPCSIGLLRPVETSCSRQLESLASDSAEIDKYNPFFDEWIDEFRDEILDIAETEKIPVELDEIQIHSDDGGIGRKRVKIVNEKDMLVTLDPQPQTWALIAGFINNLPMHRCMIAFSSHDEFEKKFHVLGSMKTTTLRPIIQQFRDTMILIVAGFEYVGIPRAFAFYYKDEDKMNNAIRRGLKYPNL